MMGEKAMEEEKKNKTEQEALNAAIKLCGAKTFGVVDHSFLCKSVSILEPSEPISVPEDCLVSDAITLMQKHSLGCLVVVDERGCLSGIFTERDCILKVMKDETSRSKTIANFMTRDPAAEEFDITIAYALSMMSHGGFRHLPLVDKDKMPVGIISVKDIVDYIASTTFDDIMNFESA